MRISSRIGTNIRTPPAVKNRLFRVEYWAEVILSSPVALSRTAPVADWYLVSPSVAIKMRVVPGMIEYFGVIYQDILERLLLTSVNNTGSGVEDVERVSVADRLVDSPVAASWGGSGDWATCVNQYRLH